MASLLATLGLAAVLMASEKLKGEPVLKYLNGYSDWSEGNGGML